MAGKIVNKLLAMTIFMHVHVILVMQVGYVRFLSRALKRSGRH